VERSPSSSLYTRFVAGVAFPLHERLKGHDSVRKLEELERTQWLSGADLARHQAARLGAFLERVHARHESWRNVLAEAGIAPSMFGDVASLERLPLANKETMRARAAQWRPQPGEKYRIVQTSGSTGEPLQFPVGMERVTHDVAAKWRATRWWGVDIGDPEIVVWASPKETKSQTRFKSVRDRIFRTCLLPIRVFHDETARRFVESIRHFSPRTMFGYPSMLAELGQLTAESNHDLEISPRVVFTTSELLRPQWRRAIETGFKTVVADEYGARDAGFIARECPMHRLHVNAEDILLEIVGADGRRLPVGEVGQVVITNLTTSAFPFVRYLTGDLAGLDPAPCPCGRAHPVIRELIGRTNDCLVLRDGAIVHHSAFNNVMRSLTNLAAYQIRQSRLDRVSVLVRTWAPITFAERSRIIDEYQALLGAEVAIEVREVSEFIPDPRGKHYTVICEVATEKRASENTGAAA
jgi:phenylacetate-CoA ligase